MDATLLNGDDFWQDTAPLALGPPGAKGPALDAAPGLVFFPTSGSTGTPRWLGLKRDALLLSAGVVNRHLEVGVASCWGLLLPVHHVGGFGVVARARQAGSRLAVAEGKWNATAAARWLEREQVTHTSMVPTQIHDLVQAGLAAPESLLAVVVGGGRLPREAGQAARALGWPVLASYGMTEAGSQIATQALEALTQAYEPAPLPVLPHWRVDCDESGQLRIAGEALFAGELLASEEGWSYREREGDWFATRDRVRLDGAGLTPQGRSDLQVKVLGELVDLEALEARLVELSAGTLAAGALVVIALPDVRAGHVLVPVGDAALDRALVERVLQAHEAESPGFQRLQPPRYLEALPRSDLGKPLRAECARRIS